MISAKDAKNFKPTDNQKEQAAFLAYLQNKDAIFMAYNNAICEAAGRGCKCVILPGKFWSLHIVEPLLKHMYHGVLLDFTQQIIDDVTSTFQRLGYRVEVGTHGDTVYGVQAKINITVYWQ